MTKPLQEPPKQTSTAQGQKSLLHSKADRRFFSIGVLGATLFFLGERTDSHWLAFIFKPIPIYCLIAWVQWNAHSPTRHHRLIQIGLFFGSLGDVLLSMKHKDSFIHGLAAFLVGHIFYAVAFRLVSKERSVSGQLKHFIPYFLWCCGVLWYLKTYGNTGGMFIPLAGYTMLLVIVCWFSSLACIERIAAADMPAHLKVWRRYAPLIGAVLFTTSDMMIAFDKFLPTFYSTSTMRMVYMILYYVGQSAFAYSTLE